MIFGELIALLLGAGGIIVGLQMADTWRKTSKEKAAQLEKDSKKMQEDLRDALKSRDHRRLDDWLVIYAEQVTPETRKHVEIRRDELYIETNK